MTLEEYNALSEEDQLRFAMREAADAIAGADAVLGPDGRWVEQRAASGFGEDAGESDFD